MLQIIDTKKSSAKKNMEFDRNLLKKIFNPVLHFYEWEKESVTYGIFIEPQNIFHMDNIKKMDIDIAKRPTGGGAVFHFWDFAFSFFLPKGHNFFFINPLKNYHFVNELVMKALKKIFCKDASLKDIYFYEGKKENFYKDFCMASPTKYDITYKNKKIVGSSQRMTKNGYLHQGTISLLMPNREDLKPFLKDEKIVDSIIFYTYPLLKDEKEFENVKKELKKALSWEFKEKFL